MSDSNTKQKVLSYHYISLIFITVLNVIFTLYLTFPTVNRLHDVAEPYISFKDGILGYNATIVDYYNSLLGLKTTINLPLFIILITLHILILLMLSNNKTDTLILLSDTSTNQNECKFNLVRKTTKYTQYALVITTLTCVLANPLILKYNKSWYSYEIAIECQANPITSEILYKKMGVKSDEESNIKSLPINKMYLESRFNEITKGVTFEDFKAKGKLKVIYSLNELYYLDNEDNETLYYTTRKPIK